MRIEIKECECGYTEAGYPMSEPDIKGYHVGPQVYGYIKGIESLGHEIIRENINMICPDCKIKENHDEIRKHILNAASDFAIKFFDYDWKEDEDLKPGKIEEMLEAGVISVDEIMVTIREAIDHYLKDESEEK